jgi:hypothetical protein
MLVVDRIIALLKENNASLNAGVVGGLPADLSLSGTLAPYATRRPYQRSVCSTEVSRSGYAACWDNFCVRLSEETSVLDSRTNGTFQKAVPNAEILIAHGKHTHLVQVPRKNAQSFP